MPRLLLIAVALVLLPTFAARGDEKSLGISLDDNGQIERELGNRTEVQYLDTQIGDVVCDLELRHKINIELDLAALRSKGLSAETPLTASLKDLALDSVLNAILQPEGLTWTIQNQVLLITTLEAEQKYTLLKIYPVGDFTQDLHSLQTLIQWSVAPDSWRVSGNVQPYPETESLVVVATARTHRQIAKLLSALRSLKAPKTN